jgi:hypothetical protein
MSPQPTGAAPKAASFHGIIPSGSQHHGMVLCQMSAETLVNKPGFYEPPWVCTRDPDDRSLGLA